MSRGVWIAAIGALVILGLPIGCGDEVRNDEQNGATSRDTRREVEPRMVGNSPSVAPDSGIVQQGWTAAQGQPLVETQEMVRTYWVPVTEYRWEPYWVNRWNPFAEPYLAYRYVGRTHWEQRRETVRVPVAYGRAVQPSTVYPPPPAWPAPPQVVASRAAAAGRNVSGAAASGLPAPAATPLTAHREQFGGIGRVGDEPPR